jgi:hypothetical protein
MTVRIRRGSVLIAVLAGAPFAALGTAASSPAAALASGTAASGISVEMPMSVSTSLGAKLTTLTAAGAANVARPRSLRGNAKLVVTRFLLASALADRRTACGLFPTFDACQTTAGFIGPADFAVLGTSLANPSRPVVHAYFGGTRGYFQLVSTRGAVAIVRAPTAFGVEGLPEDAASAPPHRRSPTEEANLVVTRFLVASALGDRRAACALFPSYLPCVDRWRFVGSADFSVLGASVAGRDAVVIATIDGIRGYFVLERAGSSFVIVSGALD